MRKIVLNLCTSLDNYIEGENGEIDWCFMDQDYEMTPFLDKIDTIFFGRKSYEQLVQAIPNAFPDKKKIVFSKTLQQTTDNTLIIKDVNVDNITIILNQSGKDIWLFGGANLITTFLNLNIIDELIISVHPLILGKGKPLFIDINNRKELKLTDTKTFSTGLVQLYYTVIKP